VESLLDALECVNVLVLAGYGTVEGDVAMLVLALTQLAPGAFHLYAITPFRGPVYERLKALPDIRVHPMDLGSSELSGARRFGKASQAADALAAVTRIARLIRTERIDVIYAIDRGASAYVAALVSRLTGCPFVLSSHYPFYGTLSRSRYLNRLVLRQARRIHVHSEYLAEHIRPYAADPSRVVIVPNAIHIERYDPTRSGAAFRQQLGIAADTPLVVLAGRLSPYKGQDDLIRAASIVLKQKPDVHFALVGHDTNEGLNTHGPQATSFQAILAEMIREEGLEARVHIAGYIPQLVDAYAAATIVTMPSWEEPFGLVALEGMAMAKPVVATGAGGVPEFLADGEMGLLVPPRDPEGLAAALLELLNDPERARTMGLKGRQRVLAEFTAERYGERVGDVLRDALPVERRVALPVPQAVLVGRVSPYDSGA
jgi:glycosyltransferase involved in cell wall biosynthesis